MVGTKTCPHALLGGNYILEEAIKINCSATSSVHLLQLFMWCNKNTSHHILNHFQRGVF